MNDPEELVFVLTCNVCGASVSAMGMTEVIEAHLAILSAKVQHKDDCEEKARNYTANAPPLGMIRIMCPCGVGSIDTESPGLPSQKRELLEKNRVSCKNCHARIRVGDNGIPYFDSPIQKAN